MHGRWIVDSRTVGGQYFEDTGYSKLSTPEQADKEKFGYLPYAVDKEIAKKLWDLFMKYSPK